MSSQGTAATSIAHDPETLLSVLFGRDVPRFRSLVGLWLSFYETLSSKLLLSPLPKSHLQTTDGGKFATPHIPYTPGSAIYGGSYMGQDSSKISSVCHRLLNGHMPQAALAGKTTSPKP